MAAFAPSEVPRPLPQSSQASPDLRSNAGRSTVDIIRTRARCTHHSAMLANATGSHDGPKSLFSPGRARAQLQDKSNKCVQSAGVRQRPSPIQSVNCIVLSCRHEVYAKSRSEMSVQTCTGEVVLRMRGLHEENKPKMQ